MDSKIRHWKGLFVICLLSIGIFNQSNNFVLGDQDEDIPHNEVRNWALKFGVDLWEFGRQFTKMNDIRNRYKDSDIVVARKDGMLLWREMATEVENFMDFKMNAVMRIMDSAEQAALSESDRESQGHTSSRKSVHYDARRINEYDSNGKLAEGARHMDLRFMRRFERLPVNLSISSILVTNGVDFNTNDVKSALSWSSHLDPLFANNLERDPGLSWQYFGSSSGFLRRFPGTAWPPEGSKGSKQIHDFRTQNWFVQAASSPKDIILLLDASSSMSDKYFQIGMAISAAILDTLGDDDYVNLIAFSDTAYSPVPCFKDKIVRATPDNKKEINAAVKAVKLDNKRNFTAGLEYAFGLLHKYNQSGDGSQCNQAIMLITEGTSESQADIIKQFNWPHMPVRIFTYQIGDDSGSKSNLHEMACSNKGYFVQINTIEEARERVIDYALVMARPMVMYQADHPIHWSPVFKGGKSSGLGRDNELRRRLVTTVSTPVFDRRNHSIRVANLLGVVGTDVPIDEIVKMVPQYKLGVNGYSFIVDNNGRFLYHPDLRPIGDEDQYLDQLKAKYASVDISELLLPDSELPGSEHEINEENKKLLYEMRNEMVQQKIGDIELTVLQHYDQMKRVTSRTLRYYYGPIEGTPFSLALALPDNYGTNEVVSQQEIRHSRSNVTEYFKGENWRVHPDWVYCEYNSISDLEKERENSGEVLSREHEPSFATPEEQVLHFLARAGRPGWKWMSVRPRSPTPHQSHGNGVPVGRYAQHLNNNGQGSRKAEPYYCDRALLQSLVRDAMVTEGLDNTQVHPTRKEDKQQGYQMFSVATTFVATRSGLLRWFNHMDHPKDSSEPHFSETNARAMDMSWYKRAVDQHSLEPDSFVFSVPFESGHSGKINSTLITATHAIFFEHKGYKAPAAVVGIQFQHESLARHFINITSTCSATQGCRKTCASDELDCYLLDNNGFVILSENSEHTGRFFGQIDGTIMDSLVQDRIYKRVTLMDYQGVCSDKDNPYTAAGGILRPPKAVAWFFKHVWTFFGTWLSALPNPVKSWAHDNEYLYTEEDFEENTYPDEYEPMEEYPPLDDLDDGFTTPDVDRATQQPKIVQNSAGIPRAKPDAKNARQCDLKTDLYVLQPERLNQSGQSNPLKGKLTNCHSSGCERPFSVQKIPHSNLILLVVDTLCPCGSKQLDIEPMEAAGGIGACSARKQSKEQLPRTRPTKCINYHPEEIVIQQCGRGTNLYRRTVVISHTIMLLITVALTNA